MNWLAYSPDGEQLHSGSSDGIVRVWNAAEDQPAQVLEATNAEVRSIAVSRDGRWLAAGIRYEQVKVWDRKTWQEHLSFKGHESDVWAVGFTPDSGTLVSGTLVSGNGDWNRPGQVKLWNGRAAGKLIRSNIPAKCSAWLFPRTVAPWPRAGETRLCVCWN